jgi:hypothetical protein
MNKPDSQQKSLAIKLKQRARALMLAGLAAAPAVLLAFGPDWPKLPPLAGE